MLWSGCTDTSVEPIQGDLNIIPMPAYVQKEKGTYIIDQDTWIQMDSFSRPSFDPLQVFMEAFRMKSGYSIPVLSGDQAHGDDHDLILIIKSPVKGHPDGYRLSIKPYGIIISASTEQGIFYAFQTLRQIMRLETVTDLKGGHRTWTLPVVDILDQPEFSYRGMHLDVSRHMMPVWFVKKYIDLLAYYKMNRFHWHLTDDQGWRIEIKKYPKLQDIAAWRKETLVGHYREEPDVYDGKKYGGYYTQEEIKEIVAFAESRGVMVIPEIEMPGHAQALLAAYPELGCTPGPFEVATTWGVFEDVLCPKEETFLFLQDVLDEVMALFPSPYIHVGGDECPKTRWKESPFCQELMRRESLEDEHALQSYFIKRIESYINSKGRRIIGWDEIMEGGLAPDATVMSWRGMQGGMEAAKAGHDVIMTPGSHCYFDYYQFDPQEEPLAIGGLIPLDKVYAFQPVPGELTKEQSQHILGAQANVWTEYITTPEKAEYMAFPRALALAEVLWTPASGRKWEEFVTRLHHHTDRLKGMNVHFADHLGVPSVKVNPGPDGIGLIWTTYLPLQTIFYVRDTTLQVWETAMSGDTTFITGAGPVFYKTSESAIRSVEYQPSLSAKSRLSVHPLPDARYPGRNSVETLRDGLLGKNAFNGEDWCAWQGQKVDITFDFPQPVAVDSMLIGLIADPGSWVHLPVEIKIFTALTPGQFRPAGSWTPESAISGRNVARMRLDGQQVSGLRLEIMPLNPIPEGLPGAGQGAWTFIDEVRIY